MPSAKRRENPTPAFLAANFPALREEVSTQHYRLPTIACRMTLQCSTIFVDGNRRRSEKSMDVLLQARRITGLRFVSLSIRRAPKRL